ncbi:MAG: DEAD/DEAH box helicase [Clostridia bacterium]|nr:DEAD/DEAH box helicase [Clostridia bacterium]
MAYQKKTTGKYAASGGFGALNFIFTENSFILDDAGNTPMEESAKIFRNDKYRALYGMGFEKKPEKITPSANFLYLVSVTFSDLLTKKPEIELARERLEITPDEVMETLLSSVPYVLGSEHVTNKWVTKIFKELKKIYAEDIKKYDGTVAMYLAEKTQRLHVPERIYFHLVDNKDEKYPFAFLATYATKTEGKKTRHLPLKYALTEYGGDTAKLVSLLSCLNRAAEVSPLISSFVTSGEMFHPLKLTSDEAYKFLKEVEDIERTGILCRIPNWWKRKSFSPTLSIKIGDESKAGLGFKAILSVRPKLVIDGVPLTEEDIRYLLSQTEGLAFLKGKWIEVDHDKLKELLKRMEEIPGEMTLLEALKMELKAENGNEDDTEEISNGKWVNDFFESFKKPEKNKAVAVPKGLNATLRPYQKVGYGWLRQMSKCGFGACLADDMGLGKTLEVLAYLEKLREENPDAKNLLIVPASLVGNWQKEAMRFAPKIEVLPLHGAPSAELNEKLKKGPAYLTITTYGMAARLQSLKEIQWDTLILDEAQAIKNPGTKQTHEIKKIKAESRIAMTGTPIENDLSNLWSIFDFLNKGLLGTISEFSGFLKCLDDSPTGYARLKNIVSPFILRRLKTDKKIISDLPDKFESVDYVSLTKKQVVLYNEALDELEKKMMEVDSFGIKKKGNVLATLTKLKQICNHPDQYLGEGAYDSEESGKMQMLRKICETILEKRERVIVFTQFKEIIPALSDLLKDVFGKEGFILHGATPATKRTEMVERFQSDEYIPYMVISLKAGGFGLNLTNANHVVHFDRWWNPAVENQATDRTYRIGQKKTVIVHKLVCEGTIEEKIDGLINSKTELAENVIGESGEEWITELEKDELMNLLRLENVSEYGE